MVVYNSWKIADIAIMHNYVLQQNL